MNSLKVYFQKIYNNLTNFAHSISCNLVLILGTIVATLVFFLKMKNNEINDLKAQVSIINDQKQADILETTVKQKLQDNSLLQKQIDGYNEVLQQLEEKRKTLPEGDKNSDDSSFWNNN